jgi:uncharacterized membrane protein
MKLFEHKMHPHKPRNINEVHAQEQTSINDRIAVKLTRLIGSMTCAYIFSFIGVGAVVGAITGNILLALIFGSVSSNFLQLVLLPVIMVGQNVLNRKQELQSDEQFCTTNKIYHDIEQIIQHQSAQDEELLIQSKMLEDIIHLLRRAKA